MTTILDSKRSPNEKVLELVRGEKFISIPLFRQGDFVSEKNFDHGYQSAQCAYGVVAQKLRIPAD